MTYTCLTAKGYLRVFLIFICKYALNPGFGLSQCVDWWEIFYFYFDMRGKFGDSVNVWRTQAAVSISLLLGYTGVKGWIKRVSAPYAQDLQSPTSTLQPSCNMDYYLWKSLHVVRTWAVSLSSSDGERESTFLCLRCSFSIPIPVLISISVYSLDSL